MMSKQWIEINKNWVEMSKNDIKMKLHIVTNIKVRVESKWSCRLKIYSLPHFEAYEGDTHFWGTSEVLDLRPQPKLECVVWNVNVCLQNDSFDT